MPVLELTEASTADALRRVASLATVPSHLAAWAYETFGPDEELAAAAVMDPGRLDEARESLSYVRKHGNTHVVPYWQQVIAQRTRLLKLRPRRPRPPKDSSQWILDRLELERDAQASSRAVVETAERTGDGVAIVVVVTERDPVLLADQLLLAVGMFPIGRGWRPVTTDEAGADLSFALTRDLAYRSQRNPARAPAGAAEAAGETLLVELAPHARLCNGSPLGKSSRGSTPVSRNTFDWALGVYGPERAAVVVVTGED